MYTNPLAVQNDLRVNDLHCCYTMLSVLFRQLYHHFFQRNCDDISQLPFVPAEVHRKVVT